MSMSRIKINLSFVPKSLSLEGVHLVVVLSESTCDGRFIIVGVGFNCGCVVTPPQRRTSPVISPLGRHPTSTYWPLGSTRLLASSKYIYLLKAKESGTEELSSGGVAFARVCGLC